eukprot:1195313-Prorocentrum_minimum.AAC.11
MYTSRLHPGCVCLYQLMTAFVVQFIPSANLWAPLAEEQAQPSDLLSDIARASVGVGRNRRQGGEDVGHGVPRVPTGALEGSRGGPYTIWRGLEGVRTRFVHSPRAAARPSVRHGSSCILSRVYMTAAP